VRAYVPASTLTGERHQPLVRAASMPIREADVRPNKPDSLERTYVLDQAIRAVRPCGVVSVPGVYGGPVSVNMGSIVQKGLRLCSGQTHVKRYLEPLTKLIQEKKVDTTFMITHRSNDLADGPDLYQTFKAKKDGCVKVVFHPA
jgi:threonine dehydrogenase-like Zn-dependent dehydrogenase